ncbi:hypothetical protein V2J09_015523 [Rumex salicifolius]
MGLYSGQSYNQIPMWDTILTRSNKKKFSLRNSRKFSKKQHVPKGTTQDQNQKNYCAPGSYLRYLQLKKMENSKGQRSSLAKEFENLEKELSLSAEGLRMKLGNVRDGYEGDFVGAGNNVRDVDEDNIVEDASNDHNDVAIEPDTLVEKGNPGGAKWEKFSKAWHFDGSLINWLGYQTRFEKPFWK